jgi:hypothetical protein
MNEILDFDTQAMEFWCLYVSSLHVRRTDITVVPLRDLAFKAI